MPGGIPFDLWRDVIDHIEEPKKVAAVIKHVGHPWNEMDASPDALWFIADATHTVGRIDAATNKVVASITASSSERTCAGRASTRPIACKRIPFCCRSGSSLRR